MSLRARLCVRVCPAVSIDYRKKIPIVPKKAEKKEKNAPLSRFSLMVDVLWFPLFSRVHATL